MHISDFSFIKIMFVCFMSVINRQRSPSRHTYAQCQILPLKCLTSLMPSTTSHTMTLSWEWVSGKTKHKTHIGLNKQRGFWPIALDTIFCTVPVSLEGNASQKVLRCLQEARHSETWSSGFHCFGYPVETLQQESLFNPSVAWCIQCHPVCKPWGSMCLYSWLNPL